jgi:hypothetical protein
MHKWKKTNLLTRPLAVRQRLGLPFAAVIACAVLVPEHAKAIGVQDGIQELVFVRVLIDGPNE